MLRCGVVLGGLRRVRVGCRSRRHCRLLRGGRGILLGRIILRCVAVLLAYVVLRRVLLLRGIRIVGGRSAVGIRKGGGIRIVEPSALGVALLGHQDDVEDDRAQHCQNADGEHDDADGGQVVLVAAQDAYHASADKSYAAGKENQRDELDSVDDGQHGSA